jgi:hypothetical protein
MGRGGGCGKETLYRGGERWNGTGSWTSSLIGLKSQSSVADPVQMPCGGVAMATDIASLDIATKLTSGHGGHYQYLTRPIQSLKPISNPVLNP